MTSPYRGIFVTGTDTDVGKTVVTATILTSLRHAAGVDAVPMKPVQTGCAVDGAGNLISEDLEFALIASDIVVPDPEDKPHMVPYRFRRPCSPHLAAKLEGTTIDVARIRTSFEFLASRHDCVVVEGAGGVRVPICDGVDMLGLMTQLALPVVIASRPGLGTLNHTLLTIDAVRTAGLTVVGVVFCETHATKWTSIEQDNWTTIERLGNTEILCRIPFSHDLQIGIPEVPPVCGMPGDESGVCPPYFARIEEAVT